MPNSKNAIQSSFHFQESGFLRNLLIEYRRISDLIPNEKNPRNHDDVHVRKIAESIQSFGFSNPILVDEKNVILAGHGRFLAAEYLGLKLIPVISIRDMTPAQKKAFLIADNRLAELSDWHNENLAVQLREIFELESDFDITVTGFEAPEIDLIIGEQAKSSELDPPIQLISKGPTISQKGDLWKLGRHRCFCGDATQIESYESLMQGEFAQMVFTDPPFNLAVKNIVGKGKFRHREFPMASGEMSPSEFKSFLKKFLRNVHTYGSDGAIFFICIDWRHIGDLLGISDDLRLESKNICVWDKGRGGMGSLYRSQHELVVVLKNGKAPHINNIELGRHGRNRTNIWKYPPATIGGETDLSLHPTAKPVAMVADAMKDCSKRGGVVLDPFAGSGTTIMAAENTGRRAFTLELDPAYVDLAIRRWQAMTEDSAILFSTGETFDEISVARMEDSAEKVVNDGR